MMTQTLNKTKVLDLQMKEAFDWSDDSLQVRDALWDHYMEDNNHNTLKTTADMKKYLDIPDSDVRAEAEKILK